MKKCVVMALVLLLAAVLAMPASALEAAIDRQEEAVDVKGLEREARRNGGIVDYGTGLNEGLAELLETGTGELKGIFRRAARSGVLLLIVLLLCGMADAMQMTCGKDGNPAVPLVGAVAVTAIAVVDVNSLLGIGRNTVNHMASFSNVLLPTVAAVTATTGAVTGAAVRQMAAVLFCDLLVNLIDKLLVPLLYGFVALSVAHAVMGNGGLWQVAKFLKWAATTMLTVMMMAFVGYLSLSGVVAGGADAISVKAAKFAISSAIPVVGGILADAAETVLASAGVLKSTIGVFGALTVLGICLLPMLQMAVHYLVYKLVAALAALLGGDRLCVLVERIGSAFGLMMGMTGSCCLLLLIALVSSVSVAAI